MNLSLIRDVLVVITTIITILGVCIKTLNKFFLETIKCKYKMIPGKQSLFDTILKSIIFFLVIFSGIISIIMVTYTIYKGGSNLNTNDLLDLNANVYELTGFIIALLFYYIIFSTRIVFKVLEDLFLQKVEQDFSKRYGERKKFNSSSIVLLKNIKKILSKLKFISIKKVNAFNILIAMFFVILSASLIITYIIKGVNKDDMESIYILSLIGIAGLICSVISISLLDVVEVVHNNYVYEISMEQEIIICRCYLEYNEHYLVLQGGNQRYISKGKVKEIRKSKGFQLQI
ncbi:hypothetical protein [Clostridium beijerinckii]|uniref:hypothetical protein n=1 Tax=Clostridium beijerinckii TaxID=1520 RepID=UPI0013616D66|nr:hypothetical protein [Clostridium beijerinckii]MZK50957.1 hypothetical protein [Clostridium beijerinckii]MZK59159.1 hypothetical protein [Clostridium beijerinckii]MZK69278.1 hypothetical protein [Clostridium beijerinckii]MZK74651.1 hypothetical protein [Clostridium beijerinckii]MZK84370.1 hypothetical protein [Clostridium beijerinckii]